jgi:hypothetical protein
MHAIKKTLTDDILESMTPLEMTHDEGIFLERMTIKNKEEFAKFAKENKQQIFRYFRDTDESTTTSSGYDEIMKKMDEIAQKTTIQIDILPHDDTQAEITAKDFETLLPSFKREQRQKITQAYNITKEKDVTATLYILKYLGMDKINTKTEKTSNTKLQT